MGEAAAYCVAACPMHTDARQMWGLSARGNTKRPSSACARRSRPPRWEGSAPIPARGQVQARRNEESVPAIAARKRFVADRCDDEGLWDLAVAQEVPQRIAVIGQAAGAQAALDLRQEGTHRLHLLRSPRCGSGTLRSGFPNTGFPGQIIDRQIRRKIGVEFRLGVEIGRDILFDSSRDYDAVLIAVGGHKHHPPHPGKRSRRRAECRRFPAGREPGEAPAFGNSVVVIGGGNVGIDVAARQGASGPRTSSRSASNAAKRCPPTAGSSKRPSRKG